LTPFEITDTLKTFKVIADTREQWTPKTKERFESFGAPVERATLQYGDYCGQIDLPGGPLYDLSVTITPTCVIERKMSLDELAACFTRDRSRFKREFERASVSGAKVYLLVENGNWEGIMNHRYRSRFSPAAFQASLTAWMVRYDFKPVFCRSGVSGVLIKEILYRDIKERLERGDYG
jgi:ERCC4-type nuclease